MAQVPSNLIPSRISQLPVDPSPSDQSWLLVNNGGVSYRVQAADLLSVSGVPVTRQVIAGTGLQGGGQLTENVTLSIAPGGVGSSELSATGVAPGVYGSSAESASFTVGADGRITAASQSTWIPGSVSGGSF